MVDFETMPLAMAMATGCVGDGGWCCYLVVVAALLRY